MRHLMSPLDFTVEELDNLMDLAQDIEKNPKKYAHACDGKKLATLFYEPSTRTPDEIYFYFIYFLLTFVKIFFIITTIPKFL